MTKTKRATVARKKAVVAKKKTPVQIKPSQEEKELVWAWWDKKQEGDNGLCVGFSSSGNIKLELRGRSSKEEGYACLLQAKVFQVFGVHDFQTADIAVKDCTRCLSIGCFELNGADPEKNKLITQRIGMAVLALFKELGPRDLTELMIVKKMIMLDHLSTNELLGGILNLARQEVGEGQSRGIRLARLFLEFKERLDKHRTPHQEIMVQHNHIGRGGQAIIGSSLSTTPKGGQSEKTEG